MQSGRAVKTIFFDNGRAIFAASNLKKDRLGESLVAQGRITAEEYRQAESYLKGDRKLRIGDALVGAGLLQKSEIGRMVARQVNRILLSTFAFTDGVASFEERTTSIPLEYMVSLSMHRVLYDGIKSMENEELVLAGLGNLDRRVKLNAVAPFGFDPGDSPAEEMDILEHAQRPVTLRRLAWGTGGLSFERLRASLRAARVGRPPGRRRARGGAAGRPHGDGDVPPLRAPAPARSHRAGGRAPGDPRRARALRPPGPRGVAEGLAHRAARGAGQGHRREDGALPRPPRRPRETTTSAPTSR